MNNKFWGRCSDEYCIRAEEALSRFFPRLPSNPAITQGLLRVEMWPVCTQIIHTSTRTARDHVMHNYIRPQRTTPRS